jgi:hypothetical protein
MHDDMNDNEWSTAERSLLDALPRESTLPPGHEDDVVDALRDAGFFRRRQWRPNVVLQIAAAVALFVSGGVVGAVADARLTTRNTIESLLARTDLSLNDRVLLLQRAGTAYVRAANGYAEATTAIDSTAVEVASQVLMGAAHAVARQDLDGGMTVQLAAMLAPASHRTGGTSR